MKNSIRHRTVIAGLLTFAMILSGCSGAEKKIKNPSENKGVFDQLLHADSHEELLELLKNSEGMKQDHYGYSTDGKTRETFAESTMEASVQDTGDSVNSYNATNIQTIGVDEADIIKTDGTNLYVMANNRIAIMDIRDPLTIKQASVLEWQEHVETDDGVKGEYPVELYLDADRSLLTVLTHGFSYTYYSGPQTNEKTEPASNDGNVSADSVAQDMRISPIIANRDYSGVYVYDIKDPAAPSLKRSFSQDGSYLSSRKIDGSVYVVSQKYSYDLYQRIDDGTAAEAGILPSVSQDGSEENYKLLPPDQILAVPAGDHQNQAVISTIDTDDLSAEIKSLAVLGSSGIIYSSNKYLYLAAQRNEYPQYDEDQTNITIAETSGLIDSEIAVDLPEYFMTPVETNTDIYRFKLDSNQVTSSGYGSVEGQLLNQFSLDEHNGYLRVAVTEGYIWGEGEQKSSNNLYVLDSQMQTVGSVKGLARGESIKSVRFMDDKAWIVTFRTTDPLFGLDLSNPAAPSVLGELKIPGYSSYLHPISENTMLGFGFDVEVDGDNAFEKGLKLSLFDISDLSSPIEKSVLVLGGSGSWSEIIYQHKSLMSDPENGLYAFPAILANFDREDYSKGDAFFQGLMLINASDDSLTVKGSISQIEGMNDWTGTTQVPPEVEYRAYGNSAIQRGIRVGDVIYSLSQSALQANRLDDLSILAKFELPGAEPDPDYNEMQPEFAMGE